jgi:hypothetical protein
MPDAYMKSNKGARVEVPIQPIVESTSSKRLNTLESPSGLKKKKLGKVATTNQKTMRITAPKRPTM